MKEKRRNGEEEQEEFEEGFVQLPNSLFEAFTTYRLSSREIRILGLIIRLSLGCRKSYAVVKPMNKFELAGVYTADIRSTLERLHQKKVIFADYETGIYQVNPKVDEWQVPRTKYDNKAYKKLIGYNLILVSKPLNNISEPLNNISNPLSDISNSLTSELPNNVSDSLSLELVNHLSEVSETLISSKDNPNADKGLQASKYNKEIQKKKYKERGPDPVYIPEGEEEQSSDFSKNQERKKQRTMREILMKKRKGDKRFVTDDMLHAVNRIYKGMAQKGNIEHADILWQISDYPGAVIEAATRKIAEMDSPYAGKIYQLYQEVTGNEYKYRRQNGST